MSVISLIAQPGHSPAAAELVRGAAGRLGVDTEMGSDGSWELRFELPYTAAHNLVVDALAAEDPRWPNVLTLDYALAV
jgi:hypothetical protein